jgi:ABC-2 type transport system ATP-binding protein
MQPMISISGLGKTYASGFQALKDVNLEIRRGEIFALLGPNGAGKTTLISIVCGIVNPSQGKVTVDGHDILRDYRAARSTIGLVPQELSTDAFESVWNTVRTLSGGMKRRVMIAKALSHEPQILFLDEPTAGVDVELRRDMWQMVRGLQSSGVTIILTTHYIEEAEEMAERIGVIRKGEIILVEDKTRLMQQLGKKQLTLHLQAPLAALPDTLAGFDLVLSADRQDLVYSFDAQRDHSGIAELLKQLAADGIEFKDLQTAQSSLEDIFVDLVKARP